MISLRSEITRKILNYFFINPSEDFYVNELTKRLELDKRNLVKKIKELEQTGILKVQPRGNLKLYSINKEYPLYEEYRKIFLKTVGFEDKIRNILQNISGVKNAYIYGSYAVNNMDSNSDIDLLVIGNHSIMKLQHEMNSIQRELGREINIVNMDGVEFDKRLESKDPFIKGILKSKHIQLI